MHPQQVAEMQRQLLAFATKKPKMVKAQLPSPIGRDARQPARGGVAVLIREAVVLPGSDAQGAWSRPR